MRYRMIGRVLICLFILSGVIIPEAFANQQQNVDYIIARIRTTLFGSLNDPGWQAKYNLAGKNIEDLKKTLQLGGKVTSNPVKEYDALLAAHLKERRDEFEMYCQMQEKLQRQRKIAAKQAINDVGMEMISRLTSPKPGVLDPINQARTKNAAVIKKDFARLKTIDEAIAQLELYKKSILPSIREIRDRKHALQPLVAQYAALSQMSFDGTYTGSFRGQASGTLRFTVTGNSVSGSVSGAHKGDPINGTFSGTISPDGMMNTSLKGTLTDANKKLGSFPFHGTLNGRITGTSGSGNWEGKNQWGHPQGNWSATKK